MNYKLTIQYDGTDFHGWQVQPQSRTVQGELERAVSTLDGKTVHVAGSGRTDSGAHAIGQIASVKIEREFSPDELMSAINGNLERDVRIVKVEIAPEEFHARFQARGKTYRYRVVNAPVISPFLVRYAHHEKRPLDVQRMKAAAKEFLGTHDWTAFSSANSDSEDKVRTITNFDIADRINEIGSSIEFEISGDGFLRYMVRSIVGTLLEIGLGKRDSDTIKKAIIEKDRSSVGTTVAAKGLTLVKVKY